MLEEKDFQSGITPLHYVEGPASGGPLILLHGIGGSWQTFLPFMTAAGWRHHLFALDLRGHGLSGRGNGNYRISDYADDVVSLVQDLFSEPVVLLGHSLGAVVAIEVAARTPDIVRGVVLEDPPLFGRRDSPDVFPTRGQFEAWREVAASGLPLEEMEPLLAEISPTRDAAGGLYWARQLSQMDPDVMTTVLENRLYQGYRAEESLGRIEAPVLIMRGEPALGARVTDADLARGQALLVHFTEVQMSGVGHLLHSTRPQLFQKIVLDYLEALPGLSFGRT